MGFNKRIFSEDKIRKISKKEFSEFQKFMTSYDSCLILDEWSSKIHQKFKSQSTDELKNLHKTIKNT